MATGARIPHAEALGLAEAMVANIMDVCDRVLIAGSIRRNAPDCGDIEIVCVPKLETETGGSLFGDDVFTVDRLNDRIMALLVNGEWGRRLDKNGRPAMGDRYKRLTFRSFALDLFITDPERWGMISTIRTGPAGFSHRLVTSTRQGGLLPAWLTVKDGLLWHGSEVIPTPQEIDVFRELKLDWIEPSQRA